MTNDKLSRADGMEAAMKYLEGRPYKTAPMVILKCPAQHPRWVLCRIFRGFKPFTLPPIKIK